MASTGVFVTSMAFRCPFCGLAAGVGDSTASSVASSSDLRRSFSVFHSLPYCDGFRDLDPIAFAMKALAVKKEVAQALSLIHI